MLYRRVVHKSSTTVWETDDHLSYCLQVQQIINHGVFSHRFSLHIPLRVYWSQDHIAWCSHREQDKNVPSVCVLQGMRGRCVWWRLREWSSLWLSPTCPARLNWPPTSLRQWKAAICLLLGGYVLIFFVKLETKWIVCFHRRFKSASSCSSMRVPHSKAHLCF